ncbi:MAG: CHAT domain-containing protein, partial [Geminicoccaceae bacterium]
APTARPASVGRALFELLWPERIKETANEDRNLRLVLDPHTAAFPWELLDDRRPWTEAAIGVDGDRRGPAAVRAGLVRQLVQAQFRERPVAATGPRRALVVGDPTAEPQPGFLTLPGAAMEAEAVAAKLRAAGYEVTSLIGDRVRPEQVIAALFEQAWTVVHIAAHGAVDFPVLDPDGGMRRETGIVLGGGLFLGPAVLAQLPVVPSLVFVNCCHLGKVDPKAEAAALAQVGQRPLLAASVGVELIRIGVRGVVAAGWAVDDVAASRFAETFYDRMLGGDGFGMASLAARQVIYREGSPDQTWGAYQCYGEPDWRLLEDGRRGPAGGYRPPASLAEAVAEADEITESAQVGLDRDPRSLRHRLDRLNKARRGQAFEAEPLLCIALARAYG